MKAKIGIIRCNAMHGKITHCGFRPRSSCSGAGSFVTVAPTQIIDNANRRA